MSSIPPVVESTIVHESFVKIRRDRLRLSDESHYDYYTLVTKAPSVVVLAMTFSQQFVLNREYRYPVGETLLCCPGGYIDGDESPLDAAKRELQEETGFISSHFFLLSSAFPYPGLSDQKIYFVGAENAQKKMEPSLEPTEVVSAVLKTEAEIKEAILQGEQIDGTLCTALFFHQMIGLYV